MKSFKYCVTIILIFGFLGCAGPTHTNRQTKNGALIGAGVGAVVGQLIGRDTQGTLVGAAIGSAVGALTGNKVGSYMDKQEAELRAAVAASEAASIQRVNDALIATFKSDVMFDSNSSILKNGAGYEMIRVANILKKYPQTTIRVEGHTDRRGSESYNQKLSERRAMSVKNTLIQHSIQADRIRAVGFGESMPVGTNHSQNRRVTLVIEPQTRG